MSTLALLVLLAPAAAQDPLEGQLPKRDLGVLEFLAAHPEYDGRGIRVAVLDTGVDPGHPFLQRTPGGGRKIVDWYDATSDGRIDTSVTVESEDGTVLGLSGRRLSLGPWAERGATYHLGRIDSGFLPGDLGGRIRADREQTWRDGKRWYQEERTRLASADENLSLAEEEAARGWESFRDTGPVYDVVVFRDDETWRVVLDSDEDGDLADETALRPFRASGDWAVLGDEALLNYAVDIEEEGNRVMLFFDGNGHGTHVAGIIGAFEGDGGRLNGVAPGVEFVAIKIGDSKFGSATSGFSIAKALDYAVASGCQVANMSFGGPSFFADGGEPDAWVIEEATRRGLCVVTSAGNEGPALTTVGAPATSSAAFSIAAAIWPDTQRVNYGSLDPSEPVLFDFSSRGPLPNGDLGISFTAPGAALSTLPSWLLTPAENFNGTSMAAPQAAGCIALLLSGARAEGLPASPERMRRALRLAATRLPSHDWVEQGHGAIRVEPTLQALRRLASHGEHERRIDVSVQNAYGTGAGIYERELATLQPFERPVRIAPVFDEDASNAEKASFLRTWRLHAESEWVSVPDALYSSGQGRAFSVRIDPTGLAKGLHSTRVLLYDADKPESAGPDAIVPVTIVVPYETLASADHRLTRSLDLAPGELARTFVRVPLGARHARVKLTQHGQGRNEYRTGAGSVSGFRYYEDRQKRGRHFLEHGGSVEQSIPVEPGTVFEYTVASRWSVNRAARVEFELSFAGLEPQASEWSVPAAQGLAFLGIKSPLRETAVTAKASISGRAIPVTAEMEIVPDPIRATIFDDHGMFYGIVEWPFVVEEDGLQTTLRMPHSIQTTELREDLMLEIFDENGHAVQRKIAYEVDTKLAPLDRGEYRFRLSFPSLGKASLEARYAGAELRVHGPEHSLALYGGLQDALDEQHGSGSFPLRYMGTRTVFARVPDLPLLPDGAYYYGTASFEDEHGSLLSVDLRVDRPGGPPPDANALVSSESVRDAREAWSAVSASADGDARELLRTARAWAEAEPRNPAAALAVLAALSEAGLAEHARDEAKSFLRQFPQQVEAFLEAAPSWNS